MEQSLLDDGQLAVLTPDELVRASTTQVHEVSVQEFGQCDCKEVLGIDTWIVSCELQHSLVEQLVVLVTGGLKGIGCDQMDVSDVSWTYLASGP